MFVKTAALLIILMSHELDQHLHELVERLLLEMILKKMLDAHLIQYFAPIRECHVFVIYPSIQKEVRMNTYEHHVN